MAQTTLTARKEVTRKRRPLLKVVSDTPSVKQKIIIRKDLKVEHKFFINSLFCEMIEKI